MLSSGEALAGTIDAYLIYRLTGGRVFATDYTNASRTLLFDIHRLRWDDELCQIFGVSIRCLPEPRDCTEAFGETDAAGILPKPIPIRGVIGDSQASLFAHHCFEPGMGKVTLGSGSSVLLNIGPKHHPAGDGAVSTIAWSHQGKPIYSFEGIINYTGGTIAWLKDQLGLIASAQETENLAALVPDNAGVYFVPAFAGLSAPDWAPAARAAIVGMTSHSNRNHLVRASLESIAYQVRDVLEMMRARTNVQIRILSSDGGASRNRFLMHFMAYMTRLDVIAAPIAECSPLGAAFLVGLGMGIYSSLEEISRLPNAGVKYRSSMPRDRADALHIGWRRAVKQVLAGIE